VGGARTFCVAASFIAARKGKIAGIRISDLLRVEVETTTYFDFGSKNVLWRDGLVPRIVPRNLYTELRY
jgi:hypothetical protein